MTLSVRLSHHDDPLLEFGSGEYSTPKDGLVTAGRRTASGLEARTGSKYGSA